MAEQAIRATVHGRVQGVGFREATARRAREAGVLGWVRNEADGSVRVHAEGPKPAVDALMAFLHRGPRLAHVDQVATESVRVEGHEQFAVRGVPAGRFVVREHAAAGHRFDLRLEVDGVLYTWALPKGPSMDPATRRLAVEAEDREPSAEAFAERGDDVIVWDAGVYEQGGRVAWPEALDRGHAVFVLHGEKLRGGFALQRTHDGEPPQWLLIKRRDTTARPGSDVVADAPRRVVSGRTPDERSDGTER